MRSVGWSGVNKKDSRRELREVESRRLADSVGPQRNGEPLKGFEKRNDMI